MEMAGTCLQNASCLITRDSLVTREEGDQRRACDRLAKKNGNTEDLVFLLLVQTHVVYSAVVHTAGTEFRIALLQQNSPGQTSLHIGSEVSTSVTVEAPFAGVSRTYAIRPGVTVVQIDANMRETSSAISYKGIHIKSDHPVTVFVVDDSSPYLGGYLAIPVEALAAEYMVLSHQSRSRSEFLITSVTDRTRVSITLKTRESITHNGINYTNGDVIREDLDRFQTWQIQSASDLTGTLIKAEGKIAVFSGSECSAIPRNSDMCDFVSEQLPAVTAWETTFIVPLIVECSNEIRILARDDGTTIKLTQGQNEERINLNATEYADRSFTVTSGLAVVVESTRPVLVAHFTGTIRTNINCGASMTIIPAVDQYVDKYKFYSSLNVNKLVLKVIVLEDRMIGVWLNNETLAWHYKNDVLLGKSKDEFAVIDVILPTGSSPTDILVSHESGVDFAAILYGFRQNEAFSFPLGLKLDLSKSNDLVRLVNGSSRVSGRLEVFHQGNWGTVCDVNFDENDAKAVCRILGFYFGSTNTLVHPGAFYGAGSGQVMIENLQCLGTELDLHLCRSSPWEHSSCQHNHDVGVDCSSKIRLTGTADPREGRLEIFYNGRWGSVCDDNFNRKSAAVVCTALGYGHAGYFYSGLGSTSSIQWIDDIQCTGEESDIAQCMTKPWGRTDCTHEEDIWVACYTQTQIRLSNGTTPSGGRLEVKARDQWHTVCDNKFDTSDANVVCRMLGYQREGAVNTVYKGAFFGQGSAKVAIDELECSGREADIADCTSRAWMTSSCSHNHDVGIQCGSSVRLVNGTSSSNGRLEVFYKDHWGSVCDEHFDISDAAVTCKQLGFPNGLGADPIKHNATYGKGTGRVVIGEIDCYGNETDIALCKSRPWLDSACAHEEDVGLDCGTSMRLVNGSTRAEGRLEVYYAGQWGTVCSDRFDVADLIVVCTQLGFISRTNSAIKLGAHFGQGTGPIIIDELQCSGTEIDIQFCVSSPWLSNDCTHAQDVGIDCNVHE